MGDRDRGIPVQTNSAPNHNPIDMTAEGVSVDASHMHSFQFRTDLSTSDFTTYWCAGETHEGERAPH